MLDIIFQYGLEPVLIQWILIGFNAILEYILILINNDNKVAKDDSTNSVADKEIAEVLVVEENSANNKTQDVSSAIEIGVDNKDDSIHENKVVKNGISS